MANFSNVPVREYFWRAWLSNAIPANQPFFVRDLFIRAESKVGSGVPGYKDKIRLGQNATSAYSRVVVNVKKAGSSGFYELIHKGSPNPPNILSCFGDLDNAPNFDSTQMDPVTANSLALSDAYKKIRSEQVSMSGMVFLGEIREAVNMIRHPARSLFSGVSGYVNRCRGIGRGFKKPSRKLNKVLSDLWLEYSFGWKPLVNDIDDGLKAYADVLGRNGRSRVRGKGISESETTSNGFYQLDFGLTSYPWFWMNRTEQVRKSAGVIYTVGLGSVRNGPTPSSGWGARFGLTAREFIPTIWELIPYSFLIDYFTNIGDVLSAACTDTSNVVWVSKSVRQSVHYSRVSSPNLKACQSSMSPSIFISCSASGASTCEVEVIQFTRSSTGLTWPSFMVTYPGGGSLKWLNLAALANMRFLK